MTAVSLAALSATPAFAQQNGANEGNKGIEDIVVTAQRRNESAQDAPIAITAFNAATIEARGISSALDVTQYVPNLVGFNNTGLGTANAYYLRGVGNTESIATFDPPIGTYIDDIYISRQNANNFNFFDVERVEVLRGPQGTLFGRNTTGGAISVVMKEPGDRLGGFAEAGYGSYDRKLLRASVDLPLGQRFGIKVSGYWQDDNGYAKNSITNETTNENDGWGLRLGVKGELSDSVTWNASYTHTFTDSANLLNFDCDPVNPANCNGRFVSTGLKKISDFGGRFTGAKNNFGLGNTAKMDLISSNLQFALGDKLSINLITGYVDLAQKFALDAGADNATACGVGIVAPNGKLSEPVRSPDWTVALGMSYEAPLGGGLSLIPSLNASWRSESETGTSQVSFFDQSFTSSPGGIVYPVNTAYRGNYLTGSFSKARWITNASLTLKSEGGWSLVAECKNCFDEEAVESSLVNYSYLNPPRTWALRAKYAF